MAILSARSTRSRFASPPERSSARMKRDSSVYRISCGSRGLAIRSTGRSRIIRSCNASKLSDMLGALSRTTCMSPAPRAQRPVDLSKLAPMEEMSTVG